MEWFDSNVSSAQIAIEPAPEGFHSVRWDLSTHVVLDVADYSVDEHLADVVIRNGGASVELGTKLHVFQDFVLQSLTAHIGINLGANLARVLANPT